jgi:hypothetical protein
MIDPARKDNQNAVSTARTLAAQMLPGGAEASGAQTKRSTLKRSR